ncbi:hypothetical protein FLL45_17615 [Aliikangiella marina]|uniref:Uncharacterized protein n=1 Tax=Aliikangiella marina TaxID=1712262 RepID=A0A545T4A5_9GAMM|nr:hypothetical protein [Aliikangiella marina]TQV71988.1 hypothetical protein FLL45_17335 [Aliikangiella marina]TQV72041.1 hypothetical protein FLL45_17615 [Aliikangiella marina]
MLTTTSFKNRLFYLGLIALFVLFAVYWLIYKEPSSINNLERRAFALNYSAFENGIRLANYQFIVRAANERSNTNKSIKINRLMFNNNGFPVANEDASSYRQSPSTVQDCRAIWQRVLGPLQPELSISAKESRYWVDITVDNICVYRNGRIDDQQIEYDAVKGLVSIVTINN